jgi:transposase-like protein
MVESIIWPHGPVCPHCGEMSRIYVLNGVRSKPSKKNPQGILRHGLKKCGACKKQFTVRVGTLFEDSHLLLHLWLQAFRLLCSSKKGISSHQLHRTLEITYEAAWFLSHRIREAMAGGGADFGPLGGNGEVIEADETYSAAKPRTSLTAILRPRKPSSRSLSAMAAPARFMSPMSRART